MDWVDKKCDRCGQTQHVEIHHIKYQVYGGTDTPENLVPLCMGCHDYRHAKEAVLRAIKSEENRLAVLRKRLELIEMNTPQQVLLNGYKSYFDEYKEPLPPLRGCRTGGELENENVVSK